MNVREPIEACWLYLRLCVGYVDDDVVEVVQAGGAAESNDHPHPNRRQS